MECQDGSEHARMVAIGNAPGLSEDQQSLHDGMDSAMHGMPPPDFDCFNNEVLGRPGWQQLRTLAAETLRALGWERVVVRPFMGVQPGVWQKPYPEAGFD